MLVTAIRIRNLTTITNNLTIPLIIGHIIVVADTCLKVAFFDFGNFAFSHAIPNEKDSNQKDNLTNGGKYGAVNHSERWNEETRNNKTDCNQRHNNSDDKVLVF